MKTEHLKTIKLLLGLIAFGCLFWACEEDKTEDKPADQGCITGKITFFNTGNVTDAYVQLLPKNKNEIVYSSQIDASGNYTIEDIEPSSYRIKVFKLGFIDTLFSDVIQIRSKSLTNGKCCVMDWVVTKLPPKLHIVDDEGNDIEKLDFGRNLDDIARSFNIFNDGAQTLYWEITKTSEWITHISRDSGTLRPGGTQAIIIKIDRNQLKYGDNQTTVHITSNEGGKQLLVTAWGENRQLPVLNTLPVTDIRMTSAIFHGVLKDGGEPDYTERGFVYGLSSMPTIENTIRKVTVAVTNNSNFQATVSELDESQIYYVRAYAINEVGTAYSTNEERFNPQRTPPSVRTESVVYQSLKDRMAIIAAKVENEGEPAYTERGIVFSTTRNPYIGAENVEKSSDGGRGVGSYNVNLSDAEIGKIFYVKAYLINDDGSVYGGEIEVDFHPIKPKFETKNVENIDGTTVRLKAEIRTIGEPAYKNAGFVYGTMEYPKMDDVRAIKEAVAGTEVGTYSKVINNLIEGERYYVRAYMYNEYDTVLGNVISFIAEEPQYMVIPGFDNLMVQTEDLGDADWFGAEDMCVNSTVGGFNDWRLPDKEEIQILYKNRNLIGEFKEGRYWTSTYEFNGAYYYMNFQDGTIKGQPSSQKANVRAIRDVSK